MSDHTPAPWIPVCTPSSSFNDIRYISGDNCEKIATIHLPLGMGQHEALANARLIAAAPDLLEVVQGLHRALARMIEKHDPDTIEAEWLSHSHEAIVKAIGETA
jgi:hypothetical protein